MSLISLLLIAGLLLILFLRRNKNDPPPPSDPTYRQLYQQQLPPSEAYIPQQVTSPPQEHAPPADSKPSADSHTPYVPPVQPFPAQPKKPFSPLPWLLFAGVAFLFLGAILFLTDTWEMLPDPVRAVLLLSASGIAFGAHLLADRVLKLQKTGLAFYILGSIFLPMAIGAIGIFGLLGSWFHIGGKGAMMVITAIFLSNSITCFAGLRVYQTPALAGIGICSGGIAWLFLALQIIQYIQFPEDIHSRALPVIYCAMLAAAAIALHFLCEGYLKRKTDTALAKAFPDGLYCVLLIYTVMAGILSTTDWLGTVIFCAAGLFLFLNPRFIHRTAHFGVAGFALCSLLLLGNLTNLFDSSDYANYLFTVAASAMLLICTGTIAQFSEITRNSFRKVSYVFMAFTFPAFLPAYFDTLGFEGFFLIVPLLIALICFGNTPKNKLHTDAVSTILILLLLYPLVISSTEREMLLLAVGAMLSAAMLITVSIVSRKLWCAVLALCTCTALLLTRLPHPALWVYCLCATAFLAGALYAHRRARPLLERCCVWAHIPFLMTAAGKAALLFLSDDRAAVLVFFLLTCIYLAMRFLFAKQEGSRCTADYCLYTSIYFAVLLVILLLVSDSPFYWIALSCACLLLFGGAALHRKQNAMSIPLLLSMILLLGEVIQTISELLPVSETVSESLGYLLVLGILIAMSRLLLPRFYTASQMENIQQIDWAYLAGLLPVQFIASLLVPDSTAFFCLLLAPYALLLLGRTASRHPILTTMSASLCAALFFCIAEDQFGIRSLVADLTLKTPSTLLWVLPVHLFLLSLIWTLPASFRESVHQARFIMYCISFGCLLITALYSSVLLDAIVIAVLSLAVLLASFTVKRLRWFALGLGVLILLTLRMTFEYRHSIHWGVYLFLIGAVLLGIALRYEYINRWKAEHPDEPIKKLELFKEWSW